MEKKHNVIIDESLCIGCGKCVNDCVGSVIEIQDKKAKLIGGGCIACGHCQAICPQNAVTITGFDDEIISFDEQTRLSSDTLEMALKTRRTIRQFTDEKVPEEVVDKIIEAGRMAPTAANSQKTQYVILGSKQDELEKQAVTTFRKLLGAAKPVVSKYTSISIDDHFFFKNAPLVIVLYGNAVDASLAAENMALMAEANGLGVLFSGFFTTCANHLGKIKKVIGVKGKAVTTMVIGYPKVKYQRTVHRENACVKKL